MNSYSNRTENIINLSKNFEVDLIRILLTGATGGLGYRTLEQFVQNESIEEIIANGRTIKPSHYIDYKKVDYQLGNLGDKQFTQKIVKGVDVIIHAAALSSPLLHVLQNTSIMKEVKALSLSAFLLSFSQLVIAQIDLSKGLLIHYPFNGNTLNGEQDLFHLEGTPVTFLEGINGDPEMAFSFNSNETGKQLFSNDTINLTEELTISFTIE